MQNDMGTPYPDLGSVFGMSSNPLAAWYGMQQIDTANQNQQQNLAQHQQQMAYDAQKQPLDLDALRTNTNHVQSLIDDSTAARPGVVARANTAVRDDADAAAVPADLRHQGAVQAVLAKYSDDQVKVEYNKQRQLASDPNPAISGPAKQRVAVLDEVMARANVHDANDRNKEVQLHNLDNDSRERIAEMKGNFALAVKKYGDKPAATYQAEAVRQGHLREAAAADAAKAVPGTPAYQIAVEQYNAATTAYNEAVARDTARQSAAAAVGANTRPALAPLGVQPNPGPGNAPAPDLLPPQVPPPGPGGATPPATKPDAKSAPLQPGHIRVWLPKSGYQILTSDAASNVTALGGKIIESR